MPMRSKRDARKHLGIPTKGISERTKCPIWNDRNDAELVENANERVGRIANEAEKVGPQTRRVGDPRFVRKFYLLI